jgi:hypothetical protein
MNDVLAHPLGPLQWALASCDGSLCDTKKPVLARKLRKNASSAEVSIKPSAVIIDGLSLVQKVMGNDQKKIHS